MTGLRERRLLAASGIAFVVLELVGFALGGSMHQLTTAASAAKVAATVAKPASTASWVGAYLDVLSFAAFVAFAASVCARLGGGVLSSVGRAGAAGYATLSIASLAVGDALASRAGHGIGVQLAQALVAINEALFVCTWFLMALFLLAAGVLALQNGRRLLGWSAAGVALFTPVATAVSVNGVGQTSILLFFAWTLGASISLGREHREPEPLVAAEKIATA